MKRYLYSLVVQKMIVEEEEKEEKIFFKDFHAAVLSAVESAMMENTKRVDDMIAKSISGLRGVLSPYLSTPLTSDKNDIDRALTDNFQFMMGQFCALSSTSKPIITTSKVLETAKTPLHRKHAGIMRKLLKQGSRGLHASGVSTGKNAGPVYISMIHFSDLSLQPVIHAAVQKYFAAVAETGYRCISDSIDAAEYIQNEGNATGGNTVLLQWDGSDELLSSIRPRIPAVMKQYGAADVLLLTKATESGYGAAYRLHCTVNVHAHAIGSMIIAIAGDDETVANSFLTHATVTVIDKLL